MIRLYVKIPEPGQQSPQIIGSFATFGKRLGSLTTLGEKLESLTNFGEVHAYLFNLEEWKLWITTNSMVGGEVIGRNIESRKNNNCLYFVFFLEPIHYTPVMFDEISKFFQIQSLFIFRVLLALLFILQLI